MLLSHPHNTSACMQPCNIMKLLYYWPCSNGTSMPCMLHDVFHASWVIPSSDRSFDFFLISNLAAPSEYYALHTSSHRYSNLRRLEYVQDFGHEGALLQDAHGVYRAPRSPQIARGFLVSYPDPLPPAILFGREGGSGTYLQNPWM